MGVGKTTTCQVLKHRLKNAVFLDGDWCWDASPFQMTEETKNMVMDNICYLLNSFLHCSVYENIIFCWVMHEQKIIDTICSRLDTRDCNLIAVSLLCRKNALTQRLEKDIHAGIRQPDILERSINRIPLYQELDTIKIDVSDLTAEETATAITNLK
jgi:broad-specificity NMP kinase